MRWIARAPLLTIIVLLALGMVAVLATQLIRAPGITFALSVKARAVEVRLGGPGAILRDIDGTRLSLDLGAQAGQAPERNNLLESGTAEARRRLTLDATDAGSIKLEALLLPGTSLVGFSHDARGQVLTLIVPEAGAGAQARIGWEGAVAVDAPADVVAPGAHSVLVTPDELELRLTDPLYPASLAAPFTIQGIRLEQIENSALATYPIGTIMGGQLQFFAFGVALPVRTLSEGVLVRFAGVSAEVTNLTGDADTLRLRLYGTAEDIQLGFGSHLRSIFPSAFEGLGALPSVRVALSTIFGILIAMIGAMAIRAELDPEEDTRPPSVRPPAPEPAPVPVPEAAPVPVSAPGPEPVAAPVSDAEDEIETTAQHGQQG